MEREKIIQIAVVNSSDIIGLTNYGNILIRNNLEATWSELDKPEKVDYKKKVANKIQKHAKNLSNKK